MTLESLLPKPHDPIRDTVENRELIHEFFTRLRLMDYQLFLMVNDRWERSTWQTVVLAVFAKPYMSVKIETGKMQYARTYAVIDLDATLDGVDIVVDWSYNDVTVDEDIRKVLEDLELGL